jgi:hypothetical protein
MQDAGIELYPTPPVTPRAIRKTRARLDDAETRRLDEDSRREKNWKRWGPYLSERQWGTVREDYSESGNCWEYFSHDQARSRSYRWGEDGLLGITDRECRLCFALALWNGRDPILKERLFGLTGPQGNHGEDVKELYYYLDSTPTHSYMKALYKYPQAEYPYAWLVEENRRRGKEAREFELLDTGIFDGNRYFDVVAEYAKASPDDLLIRLTIANRGPDAAEAHVLPTRGSATPGRGGARAKAIGASPRSSAPATHRSAPNTRRSAGIDSSQSRRPGARSRKSSSPRTRPTLAGCTIPRAARTRRTRFTST